MWSAISCPLLSSVYKWLRVECAFTSPVRTGCGMCVMYCLRGVCPCELFCSAWMCSLSRRFINVCNCDMFSVVNVYLDRLNFCVECIIG